MWSQSALNFHLIQRRELSGKRTGEDVKSRGRILGESFWIVKSRSVGISLWFQQLCSVWKPWQAPSLERMNGMWILHFTLGCENTESFLPFRRLQPAESIWILGMRVQSFPINQSRHCDIATSVITLSWHYFNIYFKDETNQTTKWGIGEEVKEYTI